MFPSSEASGRLDFEFADSLLNLAIASLVLDRRGLGEVPDLSTGPGSLDKTQRP